MVDTRTYGLAHPTGDNNRDGHVEHALGETADAERLPMPELEEGAEVVLSSNDSRLLLCMHDNGVVYPRHTLLACKHVGASLAVCCTNLYLESGGGRNIWGGDPGGSGLPISMRETEVTHIVYEMYSHNVDALGEGVQGCGPTQLTARTLQKGADARGGCWVPQHNMAEGFLFMRQLIAAAGNIQLGFQHYNGSGPAAVAYGERAFALYRLWVARFDAALK